MTVFRLIVVVLWMLGVQAIGEIPYARATTTRSVLPPAVDTTAISDSAQLDLYGNEISEAVGDYRVDPRGDLYERHAPDTAVLKLGPAGA